jgi:hypothetical protein
MHFSHCACTQGFITFVFLTLKTFEYSHIFFLIFLADPPNHVWTAGEGVFCICPTEPPVEEEEEPVEVVLVAEEEEEVAPVIEEIIVGAEPIEETEEIEDEIDEDP